MCHISPNHAPIGLIYVSLARAAPFVISNLLLNGNTNSSSPWQLHLGKFWNSISTLKNEKINNNICNYMLYSVYEIDVSLLGLQTNRTIQALPSMFLSSLRLLSIGRSTHKALIWFSRVYANWCMLQPRQ